MMSEIYYPIVLQGIFRTFMYIYDGVLDIIFALYYFHLFPHSLLLFGRVLYITTGKETHRTLLINWVAAFPHGEKKAAAIIIR